jgi:hypothetical protein
MGQGEGACSIKGSKLECIHLLYKVRRHVRVGFEFLDEHQDEQLLVWQETWVRSSMMKSLKTFSESTHDRSHSLVWMHLQVLKVDLRTLLIGQGCRGVDGFQPV